jgi:hypothetical protein
MGVPQSIKRRSSRQMKTISALSPAGIADRSSILGNRHSYTNWRIALALREPPMISLRRNSCAAAQDNGMTYTLYRTSAVDASMRLHVATFDAKESESYNRENCLMAANLFAAQPASSSNGCQPLSFRGHAGACCLKSAPGRGPSSRTCEHFSRPKISSNRMRSHRAAFMRSQHRR